MINYWNQSWARISTNVGPGHRDWSERAGQNLIYTLVERPSCPCPKRRKRKKRGPSGVREKKECKWINKQINNKHHLSKNILTVKTNGMLGRFLTACQKCGRNQCELWPVVPAA